MKTFKIHYILCLLFVLLVSSCAKDLEPYENQPQVYFFERATDLNKTRITTKSFSFMSFPSTVTKDTLKIKVKTMGYPADYDRVVRGKLIAEGTTAVEGVNFDFIDGVVKAGQVEGQLWILLYRTADIKSRSLQLNLGIAETKDFKPGVIEDNFFSVSWSDNLVKPSNWDGFISLSAFFGTYSTTKYRFIIDVLGITEFKLQQSARVPLAEGEYSSAMMIDFKNRMKEALATYNNTHTTPLTDENGVLVTFPN
ncbi:DUF4843 domain-containing protein [Pedobacter sp. GR22-6]|uniref:DUF4843 domain-containing protein n=1 Tax=Pedobacter sp. GR22-6 TaxID=3127957 RepID=UPI00307DDD8D